MSKQRDKFKKELQYEQLLHNSKGKVFLYVLYMMLIVYLLSMGSSIRSIQDMLDSVDMELDKYVANFEVSGGKFHIERAYRKTDWLHYWIELDNDSQRLDGRDIRDLARSYRVVFLVNEDGYAVMQFGDASPQVRKWSSQDFDKVTVQRWVWYFRVIMSIAILLIYFLEVGLYFLCAWVITVLCLLISGHLEFYVQTKQAYRLAVYGMTAPALLYGIMSVLHLTQYKWGNIALLVCAILIPCEYVMRRIKRIDDTVRTERLREQETKLQQEIQPAQVEQQAQVAQEGNHA